MSCLSAENTLYPCSTHGLTAHQVAELVTNPWLRAMADPPVLQTFHVVDSASGTVSALTDVRIENGQFTEVSANAFSSASTDERVVDLEGKFICPGLIDCHVHVTAVPGVKVR